VAWSMIRAAAGSVADLCLIPVQDVLSLGSEARMNKPASPENNWAWRMAPDALNEGLSQRLRNLAEITDRDGSAQTGAAL
jgi:4-alpha-glucanotransferase